jgi:hypothetical protein
LPWHRALISSCTGRSASHLLRDDLLDAVGEFFAVEEFRDLAQRFGRGSAPMKFTLIHGMPNFFSIISAM